jgi:hypothetical protein
LVGGETALWAGVALTSGANLTMNSIISFLKAHHVVAAYPAPGGTRIVVAGEALYPDGRMVITVDTIPATLEAARRWLGY